MQIKEMIETSIQALEDKKARDIKVLEVGDLTMVAEYFIIASGTSTTQVKALASEVEHVLLQKGVRPVHVEGKTTGWILLDYGTVLVHVFLEEEREHYNLERLWADAQTVEIKG